MKSAKPDDAPATLVKDTELQAMSRCTKVLAALDVPTRRRVIRWLSEKFAAAEVGVEQPALFDGE